MNQHMNNWFFLTIICWTLAQLELKEIKSKENKFNTWVARVNQQPIGILTYLNDAS
jgi:hypothetical protein